MIDKPELLSKWRNNKSGAVYEVYDYTNEETERPDKFPIRISYRRLNDGSKWSRSLSDWHRSFTIVD